jgi:hypothetical protein
MRLSVLICLILSLALCACQIERQGAGAGCDSDAQCRDGRVCLDRICRFEEEAASYNTAQTCAWALAASLSIAEPRAFATIIPTEQDLDWAFDWREEIGPQTGLSLTRKDQLEVALYEDFGELAQTGDYAGGKLVEFLPGESVPIPQGENLALRDLDTLVDSTAIIEVDGNQRELRIQRMIRLRGHWRLFRLKQD